jgi:hypothetical protein
VLPSTNIHIKDKDHPIIYNTDNKYTTQGTKKDPILLEMNLIILNPEEKNIISAQKEHPEHHNPYSPPRTITPIIREILLIHTQDWILREIMFLFTKRIRKSSTSTKDSN